MFRNNLIRKFFYSLIYRPLRVVCHSCNFPKDPVPYFLNSCFNTSHNIPPLNKSFVKRRITASMSSYILLYIIYKIKSGTPFLHQFNVFYKKQPILNIKTQKGRLYSLPKMLIHYRLKNISKLVFFLLCSYYKSTAYS